MTYVELSKSRKPEVEITLSFVWYVWKRGPQRFRRMLIEAETFHCRRGPALTSICNEWTSINDVVKLRSNILLISLSSFAPYFFEALKFRFQEGWTSTFIQFRQLFRSFGQLIITFSLILFSHHSTNYWLLIMHGSLVMRYLVLLIRRQRLWSGSTVLHLLCFCRWLIWPKEFLDL